MDDHIGLMLALVHASPGRAWTLAEMADEPGLSRSVFHERFTELVGEPPLQRVRTFGNTTFRYISGLRALTLHDDSRVNQCANEASPLV